VHVMGGHRANPVVQLRFAICDLRAIPRYFGGETVP
jgi:hypothetical protein